MSYLTGPVHTLQDFQVEYDGLVLGPGTPFYLPPDGTWKFFDMAAIKAMDTVRDWADGSSSGPDFSDVLLPDVTLQINASDPASFQSYVDTFRNVFGPRATPAPLWVKVPAQPVFGIGAKPNKRTLPMTNTWGVFAEGSVQWRCPNPAWQSLPRTLQLVASAANVSGMVFPLFAPAAGTYTVPGAIDFGSTGVNSSTGTLTNAGNTPAWPVVVVTGPCPGFSVLIDGNTVTYGQAVPAGQTLTVDYKSGTATLSGNVDRTYALTVRQYSPVTSTSSVLFSAASGTAAVTVADLWR